MVSSKVVRRGGGMIRMGRMSFCGIIHEENGGIYPPSVTIQESTIMRLECDRQHLILPHKTEGMPEGSEDQMPGGDRTDPTSSSPPLNPVWRNSRIRSAEGDYLPVGESVKNTYHQPRAELSPEWDTTVRLDPGCSSNLARHIPTKLRPTRVASDFGSAYSLGEEHGRGNVQE